MRLIIAALFAGGIAAAGWAVRVHLRTLRRARNGCVVEGTVIRLEPVGGSVDEPAFVTVVDFDDHRRVQRHVRSRVAFSPAGHALGDRVRVSYESDAAERAEIVPATQSLITVGAVGLFLALLAALIAFDMWIGAFTSA